MGDVVNLNAYRKRQERERAEAQLDDKKLVQDAPDSASDGSEDPKRGA